MSRWNGKLVMTAMKVIHVDLAYNSTRVLMYSGQLSLLIQSVGVFKCVEREEFYSASDYDSL